MEDEQITLEQILAEMDPMGRLYFENAQLRVAVKRLQQRNTDLENRPAGDP